MTREDAVKELKLIAKVTMWNDRREAVEMAIEALSAEVVRCKDCRHWNSETKGCKRNPSVEAWYETDFCNYGERICNYYGETQRW